jgi:hypothetical protein
MQRHVPEPDKLESPATYMCLRIKTRYHRHYQSFPFPITLIAEYIRKDAMQMQLCSLSCVIERSSESAEWYSRRISKPIGVIPHTAYHHHGLPVFPSPQTPFSNLLNFKLHFFPQQITPLQHPDKADCWPLMRHRFGLFPPLFSTVLIQMTVGFKNGF